MSVCELIFRALSYDYDHFSAMIINSGHSCKNIFRSSLVHCLVSSISGVVKIDQGDLGLGDSTRDYYLDKEKHGEKISAHRKFLISKVALFLEDSNLPKSGTKIAEDVDEIIDFETNLAEILVPDEHRTNQSELCNLRRLNDLQTLMPLVDWRRYFHSVAPQVVHDYFASNPEIIIAEIDFMRRITNLLQLTDPRVITNYIYMRYSSAWARELGDRYEDISQDTFCSLEKDAVMEKLIYQEAS
ncbi:hypothetical protein NECAME_08296 [Necator americanus]|uniref:Peptidase M13 N-terminal domain-containing protein n=1 Tax=Necator americanus TaxID=51031 RepID=W2TKU8_NECAM|nr:hypothetical protein NECAME_08296 [Necator americanus]ETN81756.1 hypothetical protein NECAME_08296 [Necator americanus]